MVGDFRERRALAVVERGLSPVGARRRHAAFEVRRGSGLLRHAGTCWSMRVSTMCSAARRAMATIVEVGFTPDEVTKHEPSTTYRLATSCARFQRSSTDVLGS